MSEKDKVSNVINDQLQVMPVLPLRDVVVYPYMVIPLFVGRDKSIRALEAAMEDDKQILLAAQKSASLDEPEPEDLYRTGTIANILQLLKLPDGTIKVLVEGGERARVLQFIGTADYFQAQVSQVGDEEGEIEERECEVLMRSVLAQFEQYVKLSKKVPPEILSSLAGIEEPGRLADTIAAHMSLKVEEKQNILEIGNLRKRL
ncbi:MAG: endopeptidase La, partial [Gammaproteobacteria bacterium]|nr:endopeptidase La [Gammaproteobacteria bacterium]